MNPVQTTSSLNGTNRPLEQTDSKPLSSSLSARQQSSGNHPKTNLTLLNDFLDQLKQSRTNNTSFNIALCGLLKDIQKEELPDDFRENRNAYLAQYAISLLEDHTQTTLDSFFKDKDYSPEEQKQARDNLFTDLRFEREGTLKSELSTLFRSKGF